MDYQLGLIGYPIKHSLSPWIQEQFLQKANLNGSYRMEEVPATAFPAKMDEMRNHYSGFNVTMPFKQTIMTYLDELDKGAEVIGAVNTVVNRHGKLIGYNTDGIGYVHALTNAFPKLKDNKQCPILIIGAGGAARGIYYYLSRSGFVTVDIANRTLEKAEEVAKIASEKTHTQTLTLKQAEDSLGEYAIVIQTTNIGMKPNVHTQPIQLHHLGSSTIVSDIVYQPIWTQFLEAAKSKGATIHHGHTMLLYQAQFSFEIWTGIKPDITGMEQQLKQLLEG